MFDHLKSKNLNRDKNIHKVRKIRKLITLGFDLKNYIVKIKDNLSGEDAEKLEVETIQSIGRRYDRSGPLTNITLGGKGAIGYIHTAEDRKIMSIASRTKVITPEFREKSRQAKLGSKNPQFGKVYSLAGKKQKSLESKGKANIKLFIVTDPNGKTYITHQGLTLFCEEHNLEQRNMSAVARGKRKRCKGWTCSLFNPTSLQPDHQRNQPS